MDIIKHYIETNDKIHSLKKEEEKELLKVKNQYSHKIGELQNTIGSNYDEILLSWAIKEDKYYLGWYNDMRIIWMEYHDNDNVVINVKLVCMSETYHTAYDSGRDGIYKFIVGIDEMNNYFNYHLDNNIEPDIDITKLIHLA